MNVENTEEERTLGILGEVSRAWEVRTWDDGVKKMEHQLRENGIESHITEIYSPPRVTTWAEAMGLIPGMALDLTANDPDDGLPWDFNDPDKADKAEKLIEKKKAMLLIGSPMRTAFSQLQSLNRARMGESEYGKMVEHGKRHLEFCTRLYREQMKNGLYFLHEHPDKATSWQHQ